MFCYYDIRSNDKTPYGRPSAMYCIGYDHTIIIICIIINIFKVA